MDDAELARAFASHEAGALDEAYRRYGPVLLAVAARIGGAQDARDLVHEALVRAWGTQGAYRPERGALRAFLIVCVRNAALSARRSGTRHARLELQAARRDEQSYAFEPADHVQAERIRSALRALPAEQREVLELAYYGERTQREIANVLGVPLGTVKTRAALALRKLAASIHPDPADECLS